MWGVPDDLGGIEHSVPLRLREVGGHLRPMGGEGASGGEAARTGKRRAAQVERSGVC